MTKNLMVRSETGIARTLTCYAEITFAFEKKFSLKMTIY